MVQLASQHQVLLSGRVRGLTVMAMFGTNFPKYVTRPRKARSSAKFVGSGICWREATFSGPGAMPAAETMWPRKGTDVVLNTDLRSLIVACALRRASQTASSRVLCSSGVAPKMRMSSRYISTPRHPVKIHSICCWKSSDPLDTPNRSRRNR